MNRFHLPGEDRIESLIRESFETMPGPDMRLLEQLESRLIRLSVQKRRRAVNTLPWWTVLLLGGGIAAATWWAGEQWSGRDTASTDHSSMSPPATVGEHNGQDDGQQQTEPMPPQQPEGQARDNSVIYQRENF